MGNWDGIKGQDQIIQYFSEVIRRDQVSHAYILEGDPDAPKREIALGFARMLLCEKGTGCGQCASCRAIDRGAHPDVITVQHEKPEIIRIDEIRGQLVEDILIKPYRGSRKIYLVEDAERMNVAAQNALLKTLEEPPSYGVILLLTTNAEGFLPTILSRSIRLKCHEGGNGLERMAEEDRQAVLAVLRDIAQSDRTAMAKAAADWKTRELRMTDVGNLIRIWFRDVLVVKSMGDRNAVNLSSEWNALQKAAGMYGYRQIQEILDFLDVTERRVASNVNYELAVELLLAKMKPVQKAIETDEDGWEHFLMPNEEEIRFYSSLQEEY